MSEVIMINYGGLLAGAAFLLIVISMIATMQMRKSKKYRKYLTDMYVAAKIRFLAGKDDLDLVQESIDFKEWSKKEKLSTRDYDLDNTIEEELKEKVSDKPKPKPEKK